MVKVIEKAYKILKSGEMNWSEFEAEHGVYYSQIGEMLDISSNANVFIGAKYIVFNQEEWIYWTIDEHRQMNVITEVDYYKELLDYVSTIE